MSMVLVGKDLHLCAELHQGAVNLLYEIPSFVPIYYDPIKVLIFNIIYIPCSILTIQQLNPTIAQLTIKQFVALQCASYIFRFLHGRPEGGS